MAGLETKKTTYCSTLKDVCFVTNTEKVEDEKIAKDPDKKALIKAPMVAFAFDLTTKKVIVAKLDVENSKICVGPMDIAQLKGLTMTKALDMGEKDEFTGNVMKGTMWYLENQGIEWKETWAKVNWSEIWK